MHLRCERDSSAVHACNNILKRIYYSWVQRLNNTYIKQTRKLEIIKLYDALFNPHQIILLRLCDYSNNDELHLKQ